MSILKAWNKFLGSSQNVQSSYNMLKVIDAEHARVHEGNAYSHSEKHSVVSSGFIDHLIVTNSAEVHLQSYDFNSTVGPCDIYLYEDPVTDVNSLGVEHAFIDRNRKSANAALSQMFVDPFIDVNSIGVELDYKIIESTTGGSIKKAGGSSTGLSEWNLKVGSKYLVRIYNNDGSNPANIETSFLMYEE